MCEPHTNTPAASTAFPTEQVTRSSQFAFRETGFARTSPPLRTVFQIGDNFSKPLEFRAKNVAGSEISIVRILLIVVRKF